MLSISSFAQHRVEAESVEPSSFHNELLSDQFVDFELFELDLRELFTICNDARDQIALNLIIGEKEFDLSLEKNRLLVNGKFQARVYTPYESYRNVEDQLVFIPYRGHIADHPDQQVSLLVSPDYFGGYLVSADAGYYIEPLAKHTEQVEDVGRYILYSKTIQEGKWGCEPAKPFGSEIMPGNGADDGDDDIPEDPILNDVNLNVDIGPGDGFTPTPLISQTTTTNCRILQIGIDGDAEFRSTFNLYPHPNHTAIYDIISNVNVAQIPYAEVGIEVIFQIGGIRVFEDPISNNIDPYSVIFPFKNGLVDHSLRALSYILDCEWLSISQTDMPRDVVLLVSGLDGICQTRIGYAAVKLTQNKGICQAVAPALCQVNSINYYDLSTEVNTRAGVVGDCQYKGHIMAHEIGHMFGIQGHALGTNDIMSSLNASPSGSNPSQPLLPLPLRFNPTDLGTISSDLAGGNGDACLRDTYVGEIQGPTNLSFGVKTFYTFAPTIWDQLVFTYTSNGKFQQSQALAPHYNYSVAVGPGLKLWNHVGNTIIVESEVPNPSLLQTSWIEVTAQHHFCEIKVRQTMLLKDINGNRLGQDPALGDIQIFPNPASGWLSVQMPTHDAFAGEIRIQSAKGQIIKRMTADVLNENPSSSLKVPVHDLSPGIYFIEVRDKGARYMKKFVKI